MTESSLPLLLWIMYQKWTEYIEWRDWSNDPKYDSVMFKWHDTGVSYDKHCFIAFGLNAAVFKCAHVVAASSYPMDYVCGASLLGVTSLISLLHLQE